MLIVEQPTLGPIDCENSLGTVIDLRIVTMLVSKSLNR